MQQNKNQQDKWQNAINTIKLSLIVSVASQPFEVLRTSSIINTNKDIKNINFKGLYLLSKRVYHQDGIQGFFRGSLISLVRNTLSYMIFFSALDGFQQIQRQYSGNQDKTAILFSSLNFLNGSLCRLLSTVATCPLIVLKTRFELAGQKEYTSIYSAIQQIKGQQGYKGFYQGITSTLIRDMPASGIQFSVYQNLIRLYKQIINKQQQQNIEISDGNAQIQQKLNGYIVSCCGSLSSMISLLIVHPFDNIRVRQQTNKINNKIIDTFKITLQKEGLQGFYKGYLPRLLKKAIGGGIVWPLYESFKSRI